jgi:hypothetical protein
LPRLRSSVRYSGEKASYRGISQIDPYWISPVFDTAGISDPAGKHFYEPTWWKLPNGQLAHRSHFIISTEDEVPDVLKPTYYYGGIPLPQQIYERVYAAERTANEAPELALTKRLVTMKGQIENYITDENEATERLHAFNRVRSNHGFLVVGEGEDIQQIDTALADFDALIMTQYQLVAAIARTPATKLLGTSPKGFNATGEHESDSYDQELVSIRAGGMTALLDRHHLLLCRSEFSEYAGLSVSVEWNPVRALKPAEKADLNLKDAQAAQARVTAQIIAPDEERRRLVNDPDGEYAFLAGEETDDPLDLEGLIPEDGEEEDPAGLEGLASGMDGFDESKIKRAKDGKFGQGGAGTGGESREDAARELQQLLGKEHAGVKGQAAIDLLLREKNGHVKGAFQRTETGRIDVAWGDDSFGMQHIIKQRMDRLRHSMPNENDRKQHVNKLMSEIGKVIENGTVSTNDKGRFEIRHGRSIAVIEPLFRGNQMNMLLTAYRTGNE